MQGIRCAQSLLPPLNGAITASPENPVYGSVLTFSCDVGYFMIGSSSVRCGDSNGDGRGEWNGDPPTCRRKWLHHRLSLFPNIEKQWECFLKTKMPVFSWQRMIIFHNFSRTHTTRFNFCLKQHCKVTKWYRYCGFIQQMRWNWTYSNTN